MPSYATKPPDGFWQRIKTHAASHEIIYRRCKHGRRLGRRLGEQDRTKYCKECRRACHNGHAVSVNAILEAYYGPGRPKYTGPVTFS